jgi:hypothetical protein
MTLNIILSGDADKDLEDAGTDADTTLFIRAGVYLETVIFILITVRT